MVIDVDETRLRTIEQLQEFLSATPEVAFTAPPAGSAADNQRYEHVSRVLARFDYPRRNKQAIPSPGRALCAQVHGHRRGAAGGDGPGP